MTGLRFILRDDVDDDDDDEIERCLPSLSTVSMFHVVVVHDVHLRENNCNPVNHTSPESSIKSATNNVAALTGGSRDPTSTRFGI